MENGKPNPRLSIKTRLSERTLVQQPVVSPPHRPPSSEGGLIRSFFGDRALLFLGIITSILALTMSIWSIHKNSDLGRRLNNLNSSVVDLIVKQKAAPVVEVGRKDVHPETATKFEKFKAKRHAKRQAKILPNDLEITAEEIRLHNQEQEKERQMVLDQIRKESAENIQRMEMASREAIIEGSKHSMATKQVMNKVKNLQLTNPTDTDLPIVPGMNKVFDSVTKVGDALLSKASKQKFVDDIDVGDLEKDLRLLTGQ
jgi:hypothetical protein